MTSVPRTYLRWTLALLVFLGAAFFASVIFAPEVWARVGGGGSYGGGSRGGGGSGGGGGGGGELVRLLVYLTVKYPAIGIPLDILVISLLIYRWTRPRKKGAEVYSSSVTGSAPAGFGSDERQRRVAQQFDQLRRFDPNFSEIIFSDFGYALYGRAHHARGQNPAALNLLSPYLSDAARQALVQRNPPNLQSVIGIIVGAMEVVNVDGLATPWVRISLEFEANYTEVVSTDKQDQGAGKQMSYYVRERWDLERKRDVLSPTPEQATALHCPRCGAPLEQDTVGACRFCGTKIDSGEFQWYVRAITLLDSQAKGPLLTSNVPEVGTDYPSVVQPNFDNVRIAFEQSHPEFSWGQFQTRARIIFDELQSAWSTLAWERARPHETDNIFQMHQYWIEAYKKQGLRNALDNCVINAIQPVKIKEDAFYNSITLRIWAQGYDYTVNQAGKIVSGSNNNLRRWSEYWTFIRNRTAKPHEARGALNCPNCGASLKVNAAGICEFCGGKITSGDFDWVLSKIEQDESYAG
jgi:Tim44-like domain